MMGFFEPGVRMVTFGNGIVLREPIVAVDDKARRLVWSAERGPFTHYNASLQVFAESGGTTRVARTSHKELDFSCEESVHADVVGGLEGMVPTAKSASPQWRGFGWWEHCA